MYYFIGYSLRFILSLFGRLTVHNKEKLPTSGGYVLACTHTGWLDIFWLGVALLPKKVNFMAKVELFKLKPLKWLLGKMNAFPINRENPGPSAIKIPRKLIKEGKVVGIFPSGTRTSEDVPLKRGAVTIATAAKATIVPAAYIGPNNFKDLLKFQKPHIIFGDPIHIPEGLPRNEAMDIMMEQLNDALRNLQLDLKEK